jgi:hypothetical protein
VLFFVCVQLLPYAEDLEGLSGDLFETFLEPYFDGEFKPVSLYTHHTYTVTRMHMHVSSIRSDSLCTTCIFQA